MAEKCIISDVIQTVLFNTKIHLCKLSVRLGSIDANLYVT